MIEKWYPTKKSAPIGKPVTTIYPNRTVKTEQQRAEERNLTVEEYRARCKIVFDQVKLIDFKVGDVVYPYTVAEYTVHGKVIVTAICWHYDDYGTVSWNDDAPFLLQVAEQKDMNKSVSCSVGWVRQTEPVPMGEMC